MSDKILLVTRAGLTKLLDDLYKASQDPPNSVPAPVKVFPKAPNCLVRVEINEWAYKRLLEVDLAERYAL
jgi:hypothetical protein